jgi:hypothetical protein
MPTPTNWRGRPIPPEPWIYDFLDNVSVLMMVLAITQFVVVLIVVLGGSSTPSYSSDSFSTPTVLRIITSLIVGIGTFVSGAWGLLAVDVGRNIRLIRLGVRRGP